MPAWLLLIIIGVVLLILGVAITAAKFLIWVGIAVLVVSLILGLLRRSRV
jgi:membrane protein implicated in regulation of membrane protease activity